MDYVLGFLDWRVDWCSYISNFSQEVEVVKMNYKLIYRCTNCGHLVKMDSVPELPHVETLLDIPVEFHSCQRPGPGCYQVIGIVKLTGWIIEEN